MQFIDLSHPIVNNMPVYPGDESVSLAPCRTLEADCYSAYRLCAGLHAGTHVDIPHHLLQDDRLIPDFPLAHFAGRGVVLDMRGKRELDFAESFADRVRQGDAVLLYTGFGHLFARPEEYYRDFPPVTPALCDFFIKKKIRLLGMDTPSPDRPPFTLHKKLLTHDIFPIENMTNLQALLPLQAFTLFAAPLKIQAEASPVRAFALTEG